MAKSTRKATGRIFTVETQNTETSILTTFPTIQNSGILLTGESKLVILGALRTHVGQNNEIREIKMIRHNCDMNFK